MAINVNTVRCEKFGLDPLKVANLARRITKAAQEADAMGLTVFVRAGTGTLRYRRSINNNEVAELGDLFDGDSGEEWF